MCKRRAVILRDGVVPRPCMYFVEGDWKVDKCLLNVLDSLVLPCACQWEEYEEVHYMQDRTPSHFLPSCSRVV